MYRKEGSGVSQNRSVPSFLHPIEEDQPESRLARHPTIAESAKIKRVPQGVSKISTFERNRELEKRMVNLVERGVAAEGSASSGPSQPFGPSLASVALQRRNKELEKELARLRILVLKRSTINSPEDLIPMQLSKGSFSGVVSNSQLRPRYVPPLIRKRELMKKMLQQAQELDLAFLVDATGSMGEAIEEVKDLAPRIATGVKKAFPKLKLRVAFAPYRDYEEHGRDEEEKCDFTDSFEGPASKFVTAIAKVRAMGGGDTAEDVFSGLERVATLDWRSKTRVLIHIGDAPCHGREFHDGVGDSFSNGDRKGRDIGKLLEAIRHECQILNYLFCHINQSTKKMLAVFRERAPQGGWIQEQKLENISNLLELVVSASCRSISESTRVIGEGPSVLRYVPVAWKNEIPEWKNIKRQSAFQFRYKTPATLEDLFKIVDQNGSLKQETTPIATVQIALRPFSEDGKMRWPYHALEHDPDSPSPTPRRMVVKRFKDLVGEDVSKVHTMEAYLEQMEVQTVAAFMAEHFNQELERFSELLDYKTVQFTTVSVLIVGGSMLYNMEKWLEGTWIRYSNNLNYVNTKEYAATLHAFSHWTYQRSKGRLMVTDLQGVQVDGSNGKKVFMLCDPAVHCKHVSRYERTKTNWSSAGMESFFETHQCNKVCRSLKLTPKSPLSTSQGTGIF